jgi:hypothetical protein
MVRAVLMAPMTDEEIAAALKGKRACCSKREVAAVRSLLADERERCRRRSRSSEPRCGDRTEQRSAFPHDHLTVGRLDTRHVRALLGAAGDDVSPYTTSDAVYYSQPRRRRRVKTLRQWTYELMTQQFVDGVIVGFLCGALITTGAAVWWCGGPRIGVSSERRA